MDCVLNHSSHLWPPIHHVLTHPHSSSLRPWLYEMRGPRPCAAAITSVLHQRSNPHSHKGAPSLLHPSPFASLSFGIGTLGNSGECKCTGATYATFSNGIPDLPKLDTSQPALCCYLLWAHQRWLLPDATTAPAPPDLIPSNERASVRSDPVDTIDGYRLDVANELDMPFWRAFRAMVKKGLQNFTFCGEDVPVIFFPCGSQP